LEVCQLFGNSGNYKTLTSCLSKGQADTGFDF